MPREANVTAIIQARMGSARLPGKVLIDIGGQSVLRRVVERVRGAARVNRVVIAATDSPADESLISECRRIGVPYFRGSELDVLDRYFHAAQHFGCEAVLRITSDCPLIAPELIDELIAAFAREQPDFACNVAPRTYPRGLDAEVFTTEALQRAWQLADAPHQREHVTPIFYERRDLFYMVAVRGDCDYSRYRWTLDTTDDLRLIRAIYQNFANREFGWRDVIALMEQHPELECINAHVVQKPIPAFSPSCA